MGGNPNIHCTILYLDLLREKYISDSVVCDGVLHHDIFSSLTADHCVLSGR